MPDISFPPIDEIRDLCKWLMGNLEAVGKFRAAPAATPEYLYITKYHSHYVENLKEPEKLDEIIARLGDMETPHKKSTLRRLKGLFKKKKEGRSVRVVEKLLFKGMPKIGKTRAVHEKVVKQLGDFLVFFPSPTELGKAKLSEVHPRPSLKGLQLILFLDDLDEYIVNAGIDLRYFISRLEDACHRLLVVATLRTGVEETDKVMADRRGRELLYDFQEISFRKIDDDEAGKLAAAIGKDKHEFDGTTPGSVVLGLEEMRLRLEDMSKKERAVCNTLKLLAFTFMSEPQRDTVKAVSDTVFNTNFSTEPLEWSDCIKKLTDNSLVVEAENSLRAPHRDFYGHVYAPGYIPEQDNLEKLEDCLTGKEDARGLFCLGTSFAILSEDYKKSISRYDKALEIDPRYAEAWVNRGNSLAELGRHEEAIKSYDEALKINPRYTSTWYNMGNSLFRLRRHQEAIESYDEALEIDPNKTEAWGNKGNILAELGRHEEAIESYDKALESDLRNALVWYNKGLLLHKMGKIQEAKECINKAREIDPDLPVPPFMKE